MNDVSTGWGDIVLGNQARSAVDPEDQRRRARNDQWWDDTVRMMDEGYKRFWAKRGRRPPPVSQDTIEGF